MSKPWRAHDAASREIEDAARWYEAERPGLGEEFVTAIESGLARLNEEPAPGAPVPGAPRGSKARRYRVSRFPYAVVFVELEDEYQVLAVAHLRRRPNYWRSRLKP